MKIYLVGGAVRDQLLGLKVLEKDYVVVGATPDEMERLGFIKVGKAFPVFLHPKTKEEYALARTERKTGHGYYGFSCDFSKDVTLEEDLKRRDLTINAIAQSLEGEIIDPFYGQADLQQKILRHVSDAFVEDPVRLLRVARFMARFAPLRFSIHPTTLDLMRAMVSSKEVDHLVPERVWNEFSRALKERKPVAFIQTLREIDALKTILPEIDALYGVPQPIQHHPEIDTGIHTELVLDAAATLTDNPQVRFAALLHDVGKALTPKEDWPHHKGHEELGLEPIDLLCNRLRVPNNYRQLALLVARYHLHAHRAFELDATTMVQLFEKIDAFRKPDRVKAFLLACEADFLGRKDLQNRIYHQANWFQIALEAANSIDIKQILEKPQTNEVIKQKIHQARVAKVREVQKEFNKEP